MPAHSARRCICMRGFAADSALEQAGFEPLVPGNEHGRIVGLHPLFMGSPFLATCTARAARSQAFEVWTRQAGEGGPPAQSHKSGVV
jgi:hypothetical protein